MRRSPKHDHGFQRFECSLQPLALTNIVTQFFWATCFLFLLRALWSRRPSDWALAGLSAGLSEYFYYGTRLLPFIPAMFMVFLLTVHRKHARQYVGGFLLLAGSYFVGFGPLLLHFSRNPNLYLGRGASLLIWSPHIPISFVDFHRAWTMIWPVLSENLLGISTHTSQAIIFYRPLLLPAESAVLVLGVALLFWHWRHPAAFLILASGLGVLLVGGALLAYPNSVPPLINHWTPCLLGLLCCAGSTCRRMDNGGTIGVGIPFAVDFACNGCDCVTRAWLV